MILVTRDLLTVLLEHAEDRHPSAVSIQLSATPAGEFDELPGSGWDPETPVLTHFTLPDVGGSINAVFGVDLGTPAGRGKARFISHPDGELGVSEEDDLAALVLVAVPPYDEGTVAGFNRSGDRVELRVVDAVPPEESVPE